MEQQSKTYYVIRVKCYPKNIQNDSPNWIWRYIGKQFTSDMLTDRVDEATCFSQQPVESIIKSYHTSLRKYPDEVEYVKIVVNTEVNIIDLDKDEFLEERRRVALNKLAPDDVKALGIENLATYNKLRFHAPIK